MSLHQVVRLVITKVQAPAYYIRGRFFYMYRSPTKLIASRVSHAIGTLLLPTPIFTAEEWAECPKDRRAHLGLGPVPKYMKDEFFFFKTDRTPMFNDNHYQPSLLTSELRNRAYKTLPWRVFVLGTLFCGGVIVAANTVVGMLSTGEHLGHKLINAVATASKTTESTPSNDTLTFIAPDLKGKMDAAIKINASLTADQQKHVDDATTCGVFMADLVDNGNSLRQVIDQNGVALMAAHKVDACERAGFKVDHTVVNAIAPLKPQLTAAVYESLLEGMLDSHAPDSFSSDQDNKLDGHFDTCSQDLQSLRRFAIPALSDHTTAAFLARRYQVCAAHNAIIPRS